MTFYQIHLLLHITEMCVTISDCFLCFFQIVQNVWNTLQNGSVNSVRFLIVASVS
jgi:hypothetical protein